MVLSLHNTASCEITWHQDDENIISVHRISGNTIHIIDTKNKRTVLVKDQWSSFYYNTNNAARRVRIISLIAKISNMIQVE